MPPNGPTFGFSWTAHGTLWGALQLPMGPRLPLGCPKAASRFPLGPPGAFPRPLAAHWPLLGHSWATLGLLLDCPRQYPRQCPWDAMATPQMPMGPRPPLVSDWLGVYLTESTAHLRSKNLVDWIRKIHPRYTG